MIKTNELWQIIFVLDFEHSSFEIVSDFEFRYSDFYQGGGPDNDPSSADKCA
jgi:hypothetical protein